MSKTIKSDTDTFDKIKTDRSWFGYFWWFFPAQECLMIWICFVVKAIKKNAGIEIAKKCSAAWYFVDLFVPRVWLMKFYFIYTYESYNDVN